MKKLSSTTTYQMSLSDLKEAVELYLRTKHSLDIKIHSIEEVKKSTGSFGYDDGFDIFDGIKFYTKD